jgi:hypothetical protein
MILKKTLKKTMIKTIKTLILQTVNYQAFYVRRLCDQNLIIDIHFN